MHCISIGSDYMHYQDRTLIYEIKLKTTKKQLGGIRVFHNWEQLSKRDIHFSLKFIDSAIGIIFLQH